MIFAISNFNARPERAQKLTPVCNEVTDKNCNKECDKNSLFESGKMENLKLCAIAGRNPMISRAE